MISAPFAFAPSTPIMYNLPRSFLLLIVSLSIFVVSSIQDASTQKPSHENDKRISEIQYKLLSVQTEITNLNTAIISGSNSGDLKIRLNSIEEQFHSLTEKFVDELRQEQDSVGKFDISIALLTNQHESLQKQLGSVQANLADKLKVEHAADLPTEIVDAIRSRRFFRAEEKLAEMRDTSRIPGIVHEVYGNSMGNIDVILDFARSLSNPDFNLAFLKALVYEVRANGHGDPYKLMEIAKSVEKTKPSIATVEFNSMLTGVINDIKSASMEVFKNAMFLETFAESVEIEKLTNVLNAFRPNLSNEVLFEIINGKLTVLGSNKVLDSLYSQSNTSLAATGIDALFHNLKNSDDFNNSTKIKMCDYLKQLQGRESYKKISEVQKKRVTNVISLLPNCTKVTFIEPSVCVQGQNGQHFCARLTGDKSHPSEMGILSLNAAAIIAGDSCKDVQNRVIKLENEQRTSIELSNKMINRVTELEKDLSLSKTQVIKLENQLQVLTELKNIKQQLSKLETECSRSTNRISSVENEQRFLRESAHKSQAFDEALLETKKQTVETELNAIIEVFSRERSGLTNYTDKIRNLKGEISELFNLSSDSVGNFDLYSLLLVVMQVQNAADLSESEIERSAFEDTVEILKIVTASQLKHPDIFTSQFGKKNSQKVFCEDLNRFRPYLLGEVMLKIIPELENPKKISEAISKMVQYFHKLKAAQFLDSELTIILGQYLKQLQDYVKHGEEDVDTDLKNDLEQVISELPLCVKSLFFEPLVCFYLYDDFINGGGQSKYGHKDEQQHISTSSGLELRLTKDGWKAIRSHTRFCFESAKSPNSFLVPGETDSHNGTRTFITAKNLNGKAYNIESIGWMVELEGESCFLTYKWKNLLLFAESEGTSHDKKRYAYTKYSPGRHRKMFQWQIRKCH